MYHSEMHTETHLITRCQPRGPAGLKSVSGEGCPARHSRHKWEELRTKTTDGHSYNYWESVGINRRQSPKLFEVSNNKKSVIMLKDKDHKNG